MSVQSQAWNQARRLAFGRLAQEAERAGAHAVVDVRLERNEYEWASDSVHITAVGTAIVSERYDLGEGTVISNLTGQDFANLFAHGFWPVGVVSATSIWYVVPGQDTRRLMNTIFSTPNQEFPDYTDGIRAARRAVSSQLARQARELGAHGVVGVQFDHRREEREVENGSSRTDLIVTMHVVGTAIVELERPSPAPTVTTALSLDQGATP
jgi:uncharacterized protein YbjQ (UPF0145 family)